MAFDDGGHRSVDDLLKEIDELREKGDYYRNILESADKGTWVMNDEGKTMYVNYRMAAMLGYTIDEIVGESILKYIDEGHRSLFMSRLDGCQADCHEPFDLKFRDREGKELWMLAGLMPLFDKAGKNIGINGSFVDITERKLMEMALRETRDNLEKAQRIGKMGSWVRDMRTDEFEISGELCDILGLTDERVSVDNIQQMIHPEDKEEHLRKMRSDLEAKGSFSADIRMIATDGRQVYCHLEADMVRDADGRPVRTIGILQDITDRKLAEEAEKRLMHQVNERVKELTALYSVSKVLQSPGSLDDILQEIVAILPQAWQYPGSTMARIILDGKEYTSPAFKETEWSQSADLATSDGKKGVIGIFYTEKKPDRDEGPFLAEERRLLNSISDMLDRYLEHKQVEIALRESEEKFRTLSETSPFAIFFHSGDRFIYVNPEAFKLFGFSMEELSTLKFWEIMDPEYQELVKERGLARLAGQDPPSRYEVKIRSNGGEKWVDITSARVMYRGKPAILTTGMDVTGSKMAEKALLEAKANAEFFIDIISHDIGNLNHAVLGYLELALDKLAIGSDEKEFIVKPMEIVNKSSRLIKDVRLLRQIRSGELEIKKVDAGMLLARAVADIVNTNGVQINCPAQTYCEVMANDALGGAFSGIISNMSEFGKGRKVIDIKIDNTDEDGRPYCKFTFEDNGPGISDPLKKRLMSDTWEQNGKTVRINLGLKFIRALIEAYHGKVWIEDRVAGDHGKGVRIVVMLPAAAQA